jgi:IS5 family transposase
MPPATMLRIHFMQLWYTMSDPAMEDALYEIESMRRFAGVELNEDAIPDKTGVRVAFRARHRQAVPG